MNFYNNKNAKILEIIFESKKKFTFEISAFLSEMMIELIFISITEGQLTAIHRIKYFRECSNNKKIARLANFCGKY